MRNKDNSEFILNILTLFTKSNYIESYGYIVSNVDWVREGAICFGAGGGKEGSSRKGEEIARASQENWELEFNGFVFK